MSRVDHNEQIPVAISSSRRTGIQTPLSRYAVPESMWKSARERLRRTHRLYLHETREHLTLTKNIIPKVKRECTPPSYYLINSDLTYLLKPQWGIARKKLDFTTFIGAARLTDTYKTMTFCHCLPLFYHFSNIYVTQHNSTIFIPFDIRLKSGMQTLLLLQEIHHLQAFRN